MVRFSALVYEERDDDDGNGFEASMPEDMTTTTSATTALADNTSPSRRKKKTVDSNAACPRYKQEQLVEKMKLADGRSDAILETLLDMNISCYIVEQQRDGDNLFKQIVAVVEKVACRNRLTHVFNPRIHQRCLLYRDHQGRLFNLLLSRYAVRPAGQWESLLETFSGMQAMMALVVLSRSIPCAFDRGALDQEVPFRPAYLSLIFGLALNEEISLSWLTSAMLVRAMPSVAAYTLTSRLGSDWLRKAMVLVLALAGAARGETQRIMTLAGVFLAAAILLANTGARAWYFLKWKPLSYNGPLASLLGYAAAVVAGLVVPYMGHREIEAGGKRGLESVMTTALMVALVFILSDYDEVQRFIVVGSETCNQDGVNLGVGLWWMLTLIVSLFMVVKLEPFEHFPDDDEPFLEEDQASPVGFRVPNLPNFEMDPHNIKKGLPCLSLSMEFVLGIFMALIVGGFIMFLAYTEIDDNLTGSAISDIF